MNYLLELCKSVGGEGRMLDNIYARKDNVYTLYQTILSGATSEKEVLETLYANDKYPNQHFYDNKESLIRRLVNTLLITREQGSEIQRAYFDCYRIYAAGKVMIGKGKSNAALALNEKALKIAVKYHFSDVALSVSKDINLFYSVISPNLKKHKKYLALTEKYNTIIDCESKLEALFCQMAVLLSVRKRISKEDIELFKRFAEEAKSLREKEDSFKIVLYAGSVQAYYFQLVNNLEALINLCNKSVQYYDKLPQMPATAKFSFLFKTIPAYIKLNKFNAAQKAINNCLEIAPKGHINHLRTQQYEVVLHFYKGDYKAALNLVNAVHPSRDKETWTILKAYAKLLNGKSIRSGKVLNEVPVFSKDKRGININLLIIQLLSFIIRQDYHKAIDRMDALRRYAHRYLRRDDTFRSNCFIHMLLQLEKGHFNRIAVERHAKPYYNKLLSMPFSESTQDLEVEPVGYERLWGVVLGVLG